MFILEDSAHLQHVIALEFPSKKRLEASRPPLGAVPNEYFSFLCRAQHCFPCDWMPSHDLSSAIPQLKALASYEQMEDEAHSQGDSEPVIFVQWVHCVSVHRPLKKAYNDPSQRRIPTKL